MNCVKCGVLMKATFSSGAGNTLRLPIWVCSVCRAVKSRVIENGANDTPPKKREQPEHDQQVEYFRLVRKYKLAHPALRLIHAIPNGGHRHKSVAAEMLAEGQEPGVPDIHIACARRGYNAAWIEMKTPGREASAHQIRWKVALEEENALWTLCFSASAAWTATLWYLDLPANLA